MKYIKSIWKYKIKLKLHDKKNVFVLVVRHERKTHIRTHLEKDKDKKKQKQPEANNLNAR